MLDTRFPRLPGDIGNPDTFAGHVLYRRVPGARVGTVVHSSGLAATVADPIIEAARDLEAEGARVIVTSCGFLGCLQTRLSQAVRVPVLASALSMVPLLRAALGPAAHIGVLTFDSRALTAAHFGPGWDQDVLIEGMEHSQELYPVIHEDRPTLNAGAAEADAALATRRLVARTGSGRLDAIVLECTNLGPYAARIRAEAGAPVFDLAMAARWLSAGLL